MLPWIPHLTSERWGTRLCGDDFAGGFARLADEIRQPDPVEGVPQQMKARVGGDTGS